MARRQPLAAKLSAATLKNPLLEQEGLPKFSQIDETHVEPGVEALLSEMETKLASLESSLTRESSYEATVEELERVSSGVGYAWGVVGHLNGATQCPCVSGAFLPSFLPSFLP